jgi:hypothetical protein
MSGAGRYAKFAAATICLLPSSCVPAYFAMKRMALRTDGHFIYNEPVWIENCLWLTTVGLIVFWSWLGSRILKEENK